MHPSRAGPDPADHSAPSPQRGPDAADPQQPTDPSYFRLLVESALDVTTLLDSDGRILYASPAVEAVLGYAPHELVGRNAFELVHGADYAAAMDLMLRTLTGSGPGVLRTLRFRHRSDGWRSLESTGRVVPDGGPTPRLVVVSRDVSRRARERRPPAPGRRKLETVHAEMLERLTRAAEFRDDATGQHTRRVGELAAILGARVGLPAAAVERLRRAAPLHDIGKIGIRDAILLKPGRLTAEELRIMRTHTILGARILSRGRSSLLRTAEQIALSHHEQWDGRGYPQGLRGEAIPLPARIVALADFFDALSHDRPYRRAWPRAAVVEEVRAERGLRFDPDLVEAFFAVLPGLPDPPARVPGTSAREVGQFLQ